MAAGPTTLEVVQRLGTPLGGVAPEILDSPIARTLEVLDRATALIVAMLPTAERVWATLGPAIDQAAAAAGAEQLLARAQRTQLRKDLEGLVRIIERIGRATSYASRVADEVTRLRSFLAGGPSDRREVDLLADLGGLGEAELLAVLATVLPGFGLCAPCVAKVRGHLHAGAGPAALPNAAPAGA